MGYCLAVTDLKPFLIIFPGLFIQHLISLFILSGKSKHANNEESSPKSGWKTKCKRFLKLTLIVYQIISMIMVFYFDINDLVIFIKQNNEGSILKLLFTDYNCFIQIWVNSPNWKRCGSIVFALHSMQLLGNEERNNHYTQNVEMQNQDEVESGLEITQNDDSLSKLIRREINSILRLKNGKFHLALVFLACLYLLLLGPALITHTGPSFIVYCWIIILFLIILFVIIKLMRIVMSFNCCCEWWKQHGLNIFGLEFTQKIIDEQGRLDTSSEFVNGLYKSPVFYMWTYTLYLFLVLSMAYFYSGLIDGNGGSSYINAVITVLSERKVTDYINDSTKSFGDRFRMIAALF